MLQQISEYFADLKSEFILNFVEDNRWKYLLIGLRNTLIITFFALLLGVILGFLIAIIRSTHDKTGKLRFANALCKIYLTVIRGTPVMVQLLLIYFGIFASTNVNKIFVAVLAFGINSGAYVAEIVRSGIMSINEGQFEAGRSLGFSYIQTMWFIITPQAFKNILPALANEFIALIKETSIAGFIAIQDLTYAASLIQSVSYSAFMPILVIALIYLILVMILTYFVGILERRLRSSDH